MKVGVRPNSRNGLPILTMTELDNQFKTNMSPKFYSVSNATTKEFSKGSDRLCEVQQSMVVCDHFENDWRAWYEEYLGAIQN